MVRCLYVKRQLRLLNNVEKLNDTAITLDENMNGLKTEIALFKVE